VATDEFSLKSMTYGVSKIYHFRPTVPGPFFSGFLRFIFWEWLKTAVFCHSTVPRRGFGCFLRLTDGFLATVSTVPKTAGNG
jgi:hypothetical protein